MSGVNREPLLAISTSTVYASDSILFVPYHSFIGPLPTVPENFMQIRSDVAGQNPNRDRENDANDDEFDGDSYLDPSYSDNTGDDFYVQGQHTGPGHTNYR